MKTQKLIAAVVMVSLGFAACQKESLVPESKLSVHPSAERTIPAAERLYPQLVHDGHSIIYKVFTYDAKHQLSGIEVPGKSKIILNHDDYGKVTSVGHYNADGMLTTTDFFKYDRISKPVKVVTMAGHNTTVIMTREIIYDALQRKVDEKETTEAGVKEWKYVFDNNGNVVTIYKMQNGVLNETVMIGGFTDIVDPFVNVQEISLLPFEFNQHFVATKKTVESRSALQTFQVIAALNEFGYPENISEHLNQQDRFTDLNLFYAYTK